MVNHFFNDIRLFFIKKYNSNYFEDQEDYSLIG